MTSTCALVLVGLIAIQSAMADDFPIQAVVISDNVRIRSQPSLGGQIIAKADHGTMLTVLAKSKTATGISKGGERNWWYEAETIDRKRGWVYGAFVYLEAKGEYQKKIEFKIRVDGKQAQFSTRIFISFVYDNPWQTRLLLSLADVKGNLVFLHIPENLVDLAHGHHNEDQWYTMYSDRKVTQLLKGVSVIEDKDLVTFIISEQASGMETFKISLTCWYNLDKRYFQVEFSDTVPQ